MSAIIRTNNSLLQNVVAGLILAVGIILLGYMVVEEGEPGAVPLIMITFGLSWELINWLRSQKSPES